MQKRQQLPPKIKAVWRISAVGSLIAGAIATGLLTVANHFWNWPL